VLSSAAHPPSVLCSLQADQLLLEVEHMQGRHMQLQQQQQVPSSRRPAVLLCGDFNTTPDSDTVQVGAGRRGGCCCVCPMQCKQVLQLTARCCCC
jgi:hypothetical protein